MDETRGVDASKIIMETAQEHFGLTTTPGAYAGLADAVLAAFDANGIRLYYETIETTTNPDYPMIRLAPVPLSRETHTP